MLNKHIACIDTLHSEGETGDLQNLPRCAV